MWSGGVPFLVVAGLSAKDSVVWLSCSSGQVLVLLHALTGSASSLIPTWCHPLAFLWFAWEGSLSCFVLPLGIQSVFLGSGLSYFPAETADGPLLASTFLGALCPALGVFFGLSWLLVVWVSVGCRLCGLLVWGCAAVLLRIWGGFCFWLCGARVCWLSLRQLSVWLGLPFLQLQLRPFVGVLVNR